MKLRLNKILSFLLCITLLLGAVTVSVPYETAEARTIYEIESELEEYQDMLSQLRSELSVIAGNIKEIEGKTGQTTELMAQYQAEIDALDAEIAINTSIMESYDLKRAEVISEMAVQQEDYDYRVAMYKKLMQFIYENGDVNSFELLFSSENISDYLTRRDNFNDIMNAADELIKELKITTENLAQLDAELAEAQSKYDEYLKDLNRAKSDHALKVKNFETVAAELNLDHEKVSSEYSNKNAKISEIKAKIKELEAERDEWYDSQAEYIWPVATSSYRITSRYGWRSDPFGGSGREWHNGLDIACSRGTPILASKSGVVTRCGWVSGYGNCIVIYHGGGLSSLYGHADNGNSSRPTFHVSVGDRVETGDVIAYVGTTGRSTGYHLHFSILSNTSSSNFYGSYVDPATYLPQSYLN